MHGHLNVRFVSAKQAKETYQYRNTTEKLYKANVAIWYIKIRRDMTYHCCVYGEKLPMMDRGTVRNM